MVGLVVYKPLGKKVGLGTRGAQYLSFGSVQPPVVGNAGIDDFEIEDKRILELVVICSKKPRLPTTVPLPGNIGRFLAWYAMSLAQLQVVYNKDVNGVEHREWRFNQVVLEVSQGSNNPGLQHAYQGWGFVPIEAWTKGRLIRGNPVLGPTPLNMNTQHPTYLNHNRQNHPYRHVYMKKPKLDPYAHQPINNGQLPPNSLLLTMYEAVDPFLLPHEFNPFRTEDRCQNGITCSR